MTAAQEDQMLEAAAKYLAEHFDSIQIICTVDGNVPNQTTLRVKGVGNIYARVGSTRDWLIAEDAMTREYAVRSTRDSGEEA